MKKLWFVLVVVLVLGVVPGFAGEVTFSGDFRPFANYSFYNEAAGASINRNRPQWTVKVDDLNKFTLQLEDLTFTSRQAFPAPAASDDYQFGTYVRTLKLDTDIGKALDLPFGLSTTVGRFDTYFTSWPYKDSSAWAFDREWPQQLVYGDFQNSGAWEVKMTFADMVNVHWWNDALFTLFRVGVHAKYGPVDGWLTYGADFNNGADGTLGVEAMYNLTVDELKGMAGLFFRYNLGAEGISGDEGDFIYGLNVGGSWNMLGFAAGFFGTYDGPTEDLEAFDNLVVEVTAAPIDNLKLGAAFFMMDAAFRGVDITASYKVGAAQFIAGYMIVNEDAAPGVNGAPNPYALFGGATYRPNGLYGGVRLSY